MQTTVDQEILVYLMENRPVVEGPTNGNTLSILGATTKAIERILRQKFSAKDIQEFKDTLRKEALSDNYDHALSTCLKYVDFND